jgi:DNA-binding PadR family transcriptional regulator
MGTKGTHIGELEELILLVVGLLYEGAYGVSVLKEIKEQTGREVNISGIHSVMNRLEDKGLLKSKMGGVSSTRGGRRKRIYFLTASGKATLDQVRSVREKLYSQLSSSPSYQFSA